MNQIVIGKRIPIGQVVGGIVGFGVWLWNTTHAVQIPAEQAIALSTIAIGVTQIIVVNYFGVTSPE